MSQHYLRHGVEAKPLGFTTVHSILVRFDAGSAVAALIAPDGRTARVYRMRDCAIFRNSFKLICPVQSRS
jgi:hypothetical protein